MNRLIAMILCAPFLVGCFSSTAHREDPNFGSDDTSTTGSDAPVEQPSSAPGPRQESARAEETSGDASPPLRDGPMEDFIIGRELAARILSESTPVQKFRARSTYVRQVGDLVAGYSTIPMPFHAWTWIILKESRPSVYAIPGGFVFISTGMLDVLDNEDELACMLARSVAQLEQGHWCHEWNEMQEAIWQNAAGSSDQSLEDFFGHRDSTGQPAEWNQGIGERGQERIFQLRDAILASHEILDAGSLTVELEAIFEFLIARIHAGFNIELELEADRRGMELAWAAGYDPSQLHDCLARLADSHPELGGAGYHSLRAEESSAWLFLNIAGGTEGLEGSSVRADRFRAICHQ